MKFIAIFFSLFSLGFLSHAQQLDAERQTAWENSGNSIALQAPDNQVNILDFGADNTGVINSVAAYNAAISSLNGQAGTIYFPLGDYFFDATLVVPDSVFLKGESTETKLHFNHGGSGHLIQINGSVDASEIAFSEGAAKGMEQLELEDASSLTEGDIIRLFMFDEDLMFSSWAYGTLGQVIEIVGVNENTITLADPLNHNYPLSRQPIIRKLNSVRDAGIECLTILREDESEAQTSNIYINAAYNCVVRNVESERCDYGHVTVDNSCHILIERSYFHHGIGYGGGGRAYGVVFQTASSFCLAENNVFEHLRHSMLVQSGANGNVFGYNYSTDAFWESGGLPANAAGDAVLHGNYPYMNLFEGNTIQQVVVDASHGNSGPFNTFLRNRLELYGFFSDNNVVTDSLNVIGNETIATEFPLGMFSLNGSGHLSHGNNVAGTPTPIGTEQISFNSLYLDEENLPEFFGSEELPVIGFPLAIGQKTLQAEMRFNNDESVTCGISIVTSLEANTQLENDRLIWFYKNILHVDSDLLPALVSVCSSDGRIIIEKSIESTLFQLPSHLDNGIYMVRVESENGSSQVIKVPLAY